MRLGTLNVAIAFALSGTGSAAVIAVPGDQATILAGLDAASAGDTVLVAAGTYSAVATRLVDIGGVSDPFSSCGFLRDGVVLRSEQGPGATVISLPVNPGAGSPVVIVGGSLPSTGTTVEGFTFTAPLGVGLRVFASGGLIVRDCVFVDLDGGTELGGGVVGRSTPLELHGCTFLRCTGANVGALWADSEEVTIDGCVFSDCPTGAANIDKRPGFFSTCIVTNSSFIGNVRGGGSGLDIRSVDQVEVRSCEFLGNTGNGSLRISTGSSPPLVPVIVEHNWFVSNTNSSSGIGGLILGQYGGVVRGNTFWGNSDGQSNGVGAVLLDPASARSVTVENNIIANTTVGIAIAEIGAGSMTSDCNVFWNNPDGDFVAGFYTPGPNEVFQDPLLCGPGSGDYTVSQSSPCLPSNNACGEQIGAFGQGCGAVSVEQESWGSIKARYRR